MLVDVHCHLWHERYQEDLDKVIERAKQAGVHHIINSGVNHSTNIQALALAEKYPGIVQTSLGIYPVDAVVKKSDKLLRNVEPIDVDKELAFIKKNKDKILAVGECGLDYKIVEGREKEQQAVFEKVIALAEKIQKPLVIHSRKAESDVLDLLESSNVKRAVLHSFMPKIKVVRRAEELGCYFSIPSIITRLQHFQLVVEQVSLQNLLTETDGPYLSAEREGRSEPSHVSQTIKVISEIKKMEKSEVEKIIFSNYQKIFLRK